MQESWGKVIRYAHRFQRLKTRDVIYLNHLTRGTL
nr:MAG TPA: hypothetical protein [Caudoviricetes sp.]